MAGELARQVQGSGDVDDGRMMGDTDQAVSQAGVTEEDQISREAGGGYSGDQGTA